MKAMLEKGINLILPPRDHVEPGTLILGDADGSIRLASWHHVFNFDAQAVSEADNTFRSFHFDAKSVLGVEAGASLLGRVLQTFGLGTGAARAALSSSNVDSIELRLVAPATKSLGNFDEVLARMREAAARPAPGYEGRRFFIVVTAWRAKALNLKARDASGGDVTLSAEAIDALSLSGNVALKQEDDGQYAFVADKALVFGLTLRELYMEDGIIGDVVVREPLQFRGIKPEDKDYAYIGDDAFIGLIDDDIGSHCRS